MPFACRLNPHVELARARARAWADEMEMLGSSSDVWDRQRFDDFDFGLFAALVHPDALPGELALATEWGVWRWYLDDSMVQLFKRGRPLGPLDLQAAKACLARLKAFTPADVGAMPVPTNRVERALADVWSRTLPVTSEQWRHQFLAALDKHHEGAVWELHNLAIAMVPDPVDFVEMRRATSGAEFSATLARVAVGLEMPPAIADAGPVRSLIATFADWVGLSNDLFSYEREVGPEGDLSNAVLVFDRFLGCGAQDAADLVASLVAARLNQFRHIADTMLPAVADELAPTDEVRCALVRVVGALESWMAGSLEFHN